MTARIGIDIGGTFTDFQLETEDQTRTLKLLTTHSAPEAAMLSGIVQLLEACGLAPSDLSAIVHGTTLATNAVIERRGAKVGFLTTEGFRDTLEMAYEHRYDQYDLNVGKPLPLVPRSLRLTARGRVYSDGRELVALNEADVVDAARQFGESGVEAVAVGFIHSYARPDHEKRAAEIFAAHLPGVPVSLSSSISPEPREYERFTTVTANAYVQPLIQGYLRRLEWKLRQAGIAAPLLLIQSNGGLCDLDFACAHPVRLLESGPAGGAIFAADLARQLAIDRALLLDVGGTTAKLCFVDDAQPQSARALEVARIDRFKPGSGLPLRLPVIELCEMGAGGGSLARIDRLRRLTVGPKSAGSEPGPACYARGGTEPTVTDAHLTLGRLDPARFAGGTVQLQPEQAREALRTHVAQWLSIETEAAAVAVVEIANENMAAAAREHAIEVGRSCAGRTLIAIGGAASLHAVDLARKLDISQVVVPLGAGVGSAAGFLKAPMAYEATRAWGTDLSSLDELTLAILIENLTAEANAPLAGYGERSELRLTAEMRYVGQGRELTVPVAQDDLVQDAATHLRAAFEAEYGRHYRRVMPAKEIEIISWTVRASLPRAAARRPEKAARSGSSAPTPCTIVEQNGERVAAWMWERAMLTDPIAGPALVVDDGTTILIPSGCWAWPSPEGHLSISIEAQRMREAGK